ncbi:hypothetical protein L3Y34_002702 [Caenorhabditis briggsae]|uniref:Uncharacterized protein n=1 Tax=Caenorhabditis briggsae TaxID=6238 RepID=A0AAE9IS09_CAEBR|nr:hypothetical protein L3Y34_002702 [Caenorhabditis briggsae]
MRHLLLSLVVLPALLNAFSVVRNTLEPGDPEDLTQDLTFKQFVPFYTHMFYVDKQMSFLECNAATNLHYDEFANWFKQFVTYHDDPIVKITSLRSTGDDQGEMILNIDVLTQYKYRQNFDMKVAALKDGSLGWKVFVVDRTLGCS